jgi:NTP pyrophosphohydrolases including oxidative damage repair enzymes
MPLQLDWKSLLESFRRWNGGLPPRMQVAALPWRRTGNGDLEVLLVTSRGKGRWVLPKGWMKPGEQPHEAAEREAFEEAGVTGRPSTVEIGRFLYIKRRKKAVPLRCEVTVIPLEVAEEKEKWPERKVRRKQWFSPQEAARMVEEKDLARLILSFNNPRESAS